MSEYAVVNPATGETVARYDSFTDAQVEQTLRTAAKGFETWRKVPVAERAGMVRRAAELRSLLTYIKALIEFERLQNVGR